MRRTVQSLLAYQLLVPSSSLPSATRLFRASRTKAITSLSQQPITFLLSVGYVCADCQRRLVEGKQRQEQRRRAGVSQRGITNGIKTVPSKKLVTRSVVSLATRRPPHQNENGNITTTRVDSSSNENPIIFEEEQKEGVDCAVIWSLTSTWDKEMFPPPEADWSDFSKYDPVAFEKVQEEADVLGTGKLVDKPEMRRNFALWRLLLAFRKRMHGDEGVMEIWTGLRGRVIDLPTAGEDADAIWRVFLSTGSRHPEFEEKVLHYAERLSARTHRKKQWPMLYDTLMSFYLATSTKGRALKLHRRLYPVFQSQSWVDLFELAIKRRPDCHKWLQEIHITLPQPAGVYATVISTLCAKKMHTEATQWHRHCSSLLDIPETSDVANSLICWTARHCTFKELRSLLIGFPLSGILLAESSVVSAVAARRDPREVLEIVFSDIAPASDLGDFFWSELFSTTLTPAQVFRQMLAHGSGWIVSTSTVYTVARTLRKTIPESEALLAATGLEVQLPPPPFEPPDLSPPAHEAQNQLLRSYLENFQVGHAIALLGLLRRTRSPLEANTLTLLSSTLLHPRKRGHRSSTQPHIYPIGDDIDIVALLNLRLFAEGYTIPYTIWRELITRLGQAGRLDDLERLLVRLSTLYATPRPRNQQSDLRAIFNAVTLRAIIEWGFLAGHGTWGIGILRRLQSRGVWVDERSIKKAMRVRLHGLPEEEVRMVRRECGETWGEKLWADDEPVDGPKPERTYG